jgi:hypothetical protein
VEREWRERESEGSWPATSISGSTFTNSHGRAAVPPADCLTLKSKDRRFLGRATVH